MLPVVDKTAGLVQPVPFDDEVKYAPRYREAIFGPTIIAEGDIGMQASVLLPVTRRINVMVAMAILNVPIDFVSFVLVCIAYTPVSFKSNGVSNEPVRPKTSIKN